MAAHDREAKTVCRGCVLHDLPEAVQWQICTDLHGCWSPGTRVAPHEPAECVVLSSEAAGGSQYARAFLDVHTVLYVKKSLGSHAYRGHMGVYGCIKCSILA